MHYILVLNNTHANSGIQAHARIEQKVGGVAPTNQAEAAIQGIV